MDDPWRTTEGQPDHCPVCGTERTIKPFEPGQDVPCPRCRAVVRGPDPRSAPSSPRFRALLEEALNASPAELGLSLRKANVLESEGVATVRDLIRCARVERLEKRESYERALREMQGELERRGLYLDPE